MKSKTVIKTSIFPADKDVIWEKLQYLKTLQYIAAPYATFRSTDENADFVWEQGKSFRFYFRLFGIIPFGTHEIKVEQFEKETYTIYTKESNTYVPVWNHRIYLEQIGENQTKYTDEVVIEAGFIRPVVYLWAKTFYGHRQRKWRKLLRE